MLLCSLGGSTRVNLAKGNIHQNILVDSKFTTHPGLIFLNLLLFLSPCFTPSVHTSMCLLPCLSPSAFPSLLPWASFSSLPSTSTLAVYFPTYLLGWFPAHYVAPLNPTGASLLKLLLDSRHGRFAPKNRWEMGG